MQYRGIPCNTVHSVQYRAFRVQDMSPRASQEDASCKRMLLTFSSVALRQMGGFEFDSNKAGNGGSDLVLGPSHGVQPQVLPWPRSRLDSDLNRSSFKSRFLKRSFHSIQAPAALVPRIRVPSYFVLNLFRTRRRSRGSSIAYPNCLRGRSKGDETKLVHAQA